MFYFWPLATGYTFYQKKREKEGNIQRPTYYHMIVFIDMKHKFPHNLNKKYKKQNKTIKSHPNIKTRSGANIANITDEQRCKILSKIQQIEVNNTLK